MNGAEILLKTAANAGIEVCFTNPGTTELPLVEAFDSTPGVRSVLGLFEGCCTGAADGYGRMSGLPAATLTHLGPGFANGWANLHNAKKARTPVVNVVGDHATYHRKHFVDPPPPPRFAFEGSFNLALYFADYEAAVQFYERVLGPPAYVEGTGTRSWTIGPGWLTLLRGKDGSPRNVETIFAMRTPGEAERLQARFPI